MEISNKMGKKVATRKDKVVKAKNKKSEKKYEYDETKIGFMDLSPELRNAIYELTLIASSKIDLVYRHPQTSRPRRTYRHYTGSGCFWNCTPGQALSPNILLTCKAIHNEATPILYGSNHFVMRRRRSSSAQLAQNEDPRFGRPWTNHIGTSISLLRAITIYGGPNQHKASEILESLSPAKSLTVLVVCQTCWNNFRSVNSMATFLFPFLTELHRNRKDTDMKAVVDVLEFKEFGLPGCPRAYPYYWGPVSSVAASAEVKEILRKKLEKLKY